MFYPTFVHINQTKNNNNMENILIYISQCAIWLGILYLPFRWMLRKETYFRANRYTLLAITIVAFLLPWINIHWVAFQLGYEETSVITTLPQDFIPSNDTNTSTFNGWKIIFAIYLLGASICFLYKLTDLIRLLHFIPKGCLWVHQENGIHIYCHAHSVMPFSWMNKIVISEEDYQRNGEEILMHEHAHIVCGHSWDVLWLSMVEVIQWFNPLIWMLSKDMDAIHEYEADCMVLQHGTDPTNYQLSLIETMTKGDGNSFSNHFNNSQVKQRITMMNRQSSSHKMRWKYLYLLPLILLGMSVYAQKYPVMVQGKVTDENGQEIITASVIIPQAFTGTITNSDGNYLLHTGREDILHFGMPGYESRSIALKDCPMKNGRIILNVQLTTIK